MKQRIDVESNEVNVEDFKLIFECLISAIKEESHALYKSIFNVRLLNSLAALRYLRVVLAQPRT
jgi:hypothetical protein